MHQQLFAGRHQTRTYSTRDELLDVGRRICGVSQSARAMQETLRLAHGDERIPSALLGTMKAAWDEGLALAR